MIATRVTYEGHPRKMARGLRKAIKAEFFDLLDWWHAKMVPKHFQRGAKARYGYAPRTEAYKKRKRRAGRMRPLVWTGDTERMIRRGVRITGTSKRARALMQGPEYIKHGAKRSAISVKEELLLITQQEIDVLARRLDRGITRRLKAVTKKETRRL